MDISGTPSYGERLLPRLIDELARDEPHTSWISVPKSSDLADGFKEITYRTLSNAINRAAYWIETRCGRSSDFETLPYIGPTDARYFILFAAAVKTGYKIFFPSPRNSLSSHLRLLDTAECRKFLYATSSNVQSILDQGSLHGLCVPDLEDLLDEEPVPPMWYRKFFAEARNDPCLVFHTSGTTGHPKLVVLTHDALATMDALWQVPPLHGRECFLRTMAANKRMYLAMPFFHMAGFSMTITLSLCSSTTVVLGPADRPVSVPLVQQVIASADVTSAMLPPSILEEISKSETALESLSSLKSVYYGGASISKAAGSAIAQKTHLFNQIGSTESIVLITHETDPEDFQYFCFNAQRNGIEFRETAEPGIYEQIIVRDPGVAVHQGHFKTFPDLQEYPTKDLYSKHPTKPDHWLFQGRGDDVIVFANGEKWNPCGAEVQIRRHPLVDLVLIAGHNRLQPAAIIELIEPFSGSDFLKTQLIEEIWPIVVEANLESPAYGQLTKSHVMLSNSNKPFQRTGKGTMRRSATLELYAMEIDELYAEAESIGVLSKGSPIEVRDRIALSDFIRNTYRTMTGHEELADDTDVFNAGADSSRVIVALQEIKSRIAPNDIPLDSITPSMIYSHPTIGALAAYLHELARIRRVGTPPQVESQAIDMQRMIDKYSAYLPKVDDEPLDVILTGSTGSLGSYLLDTLMRNDRIRKIYCLNRAVDGRKRQTESSTTRGLSGDWSTKDVRFLQADLSKEYFGLERKSYEEMLSQSNLIIHNQWQVDFNLSLSSFEPHIQGVCNLINFSAKSTRKAQILFVSSVATIQNWDQGKLKVPEAFLPDLTLPVGGYGQSKAVASVLLEEACKSAGVSGAVVRVGQISGPIRSLRGAWNQQEWLPTIISTSRFLGCLPDHLATMNTIDWVPVDLMADVLVELALQLDGKSMKMFHAVNPKTCQWRDILLTVREHLGHDFPMLSFEEWVQLVRDSKAGSNPGVKLLDFYEGLVRDERSKKEPVRLETIETEKHSEMLRGLEPVKVEWMDIWMKQWGY